MVSKLLEGTVKSATYNMVLQVLLRVVSFVINALILRYISPHILGIVNVRLLLLYTTTQFISREGFRRACLGQGDKSKWHQVICLMSYSIPATIVSACVFSYIWLWVLDVPTSTVNYTPAVIAYVTSAIVESLAEPMFVTAQVFLFIKLRVLVDGVSNLVKCLVTISLVFTIPHYGIYIFCIAQITSSCVYSFIYYAYFCYYIKSQQCERDKSFPLTQVSHLFPSIVPGEHHIDWNLVSLVWSFSKQSVIKQFLTEGERYVMTIFSLISFAEQGMFDVVSNLGSLIPRFVFASIEESCYLFFSQSLKRGIPGHLQSKVFYEDTLDLTTVVLSNLIKSALLVGLTIVTFGLPFSQIALHIYGGHILSDGVGPRLLQCFCFYVLIIAVNGMTECFVFAAMSPEQVDGYNKKMVIFSFLLLMSSWFFTKLFGVVGLVLANCVNMFARICHSVYFIHSFYASLTCNPLSDILPSPFVIIISCFLLAILFLTQSLLHWTVHIAAGALCFFIHVCVIFTSEKNLIRFIIQYYHTQKRSKLKST